MGRNPSRGILMQPLQNVREGPDLWGHPKEGCGMRKPGQPGLNPEELNVTSMWKEA